MKTEVVIGSLVQSLFLHERLIPRYFLKVVSSNSQYWGIPGIISGARVVEGIITKKAKSEVAKQKVTTD